MPLALTLLAVVAAVIVVDQLAQRVGLLTPLLLVAVGAAASYLPFVPDVVLTPEVVLVGLLPPLLYAAAIRTSLVDLRAQVVPVLALSVGLVLATALAVAAVLSAVTDLSFGVAFALGAIVAPPDAVAATAVARSVGLPRPVVTILEGESLLNDATALVSLRTAIAAAGLVAGHSVTAGSVGLDFLRAAGGGVVVGFLAFLVVAAFRRRIEDPVADTAVSFAAPFLAYLPAEMPAIHASGVVAVVTTGLLLGHKAPVIQTASSRLAERVNWTSIQFVLENSVFLVIGLQVAVLVRAVSDEGGSLGLTLGYGLLVLGVVILVRPVWVLPFRWLFSRLRGGASRHVLREGAVLSWAGMRGVVTLAAALTLPTSTPHRASLVLIALIVTLGTLLLQGLSLPAVTRWLGVRGPDPRADALQHALVMQRTTAVGLQAVEADPTVAPDVVEDLREVSQRRVNGIWERLGSRDAGPTPSDAYRTARLAMLRAERAELLEIRAADEVDHEVLMTVLAGMDVEESTLQRSEERGRAVQETLVTPARVAGGCAHLTSAPEAVTPTTPDGCEQCLRDGTAWVHLRVCLGCGHVGCCDSSPGRHASRHAAAAGHPVVRSLEPGEAWRWCYVDDLLG